MPEEPAAAIADPPAVAEPTSLAEGHFLNDYPDLLEDESSKAILSRYDNREDAFKALVEQRKQISSGFKLPDKLSDAERDEVLARGAQLRGVPEGAENYNLVKPEELGEIDISEEAKMALRIFAKERDIGQETFQGLYEKTLRLIKTRADADEAAEIEAFDKEHEATATSMQKYWGPDEYAGRLELIKDFAQSRAIDKEDYDRFINRLKETGMGNDPLLMKLVGDGAKMRQLVEGNASVGDKIDFEAGAQKGMKALSQRAKNKRDFPKTDWMWGD